MRLLEPQVDETILDAGCGSGFFTYEIANACKLSVGVDLRLSDKTLAIRKQPRVAYIKSDVQLLPFDSNKFDKILLSSVLQMVKDDQSLIKECNRILKSEGTLILSVPIQYCCIKRLNNYASTIKLRFGGRGEASYSIASIKLLLQNVGFDVKEIEFSPKKWGSLVFEVGLYLWYRYNFPFFNFALFPIIYPIAYPDRFANRRQIGNEIVVKARKAA